jgi:hypothetical protein
VAWFNTTTEWHGLSTSAPFDCDVGGTGNTTSLTTGTCATQAGSQSAAMTGSTTGQYSFIMAAFKTATGTNDLLVAQGGAGTTITYSAGASWTLLFNIVAGSISSGMEAMTVTGSSGASGSSFVGNGVLAMGAVQ